MHSGSYLKMAVLHTLWSGKVVHLNMLFRPSLFRNAIFWNSSCITQQIMHHDSEKKNMCRKVRLVNKCRTLGIPSVCVSSGMSSFNDSPDISILVSLIFYVSFPYQTLIFPLAAEFSAQLLPTIITVIKLHPYTQ